MLNGRNNGRIVLHEIFYVKLKNIIGTEMFCQETDCQFWNIVRFLPFDLDPSAPWFSALLLNPPSGCRQGLSGKVLLSKAQAKPISSLTSDNSSGVSAKSLNLISLQLQIFPNGFPQGEKKKVTQRITCVSSWQTFYFNFIYIIRNGEMYFVWQFLFIK